MQRSGARRRYRRRGSIMCWSTNTRTPTGCSPRILLALKPAARADRRRRRRAVDLFLPRRDGAQHPRFSRPRSARRPRSSRSIAIIARPSRSSPPPMASSISPRSASPRTSGPSGSRRERPRLVSVRDEADQARYIVETGAGEPRGRHGPEAAGGPVPHLASQRPARSGADPPQHSFRRSSAA